MANSDKNILITPNTGSATLNPLIRFTGANNTPITLRTLDTGTVSFEGTAGQLFSIADGMSGTIFSVNDISGIPSIEVLDTGLVKLAQYNGQVVIGGSSPVSTAELTVHSSAAVNSGIVVKAAASQSANLMEFQNSAGGILARFDSFANFRTTGQQISLGTNTSSTETLRVVPLAASWQGIVIQGAASQTGDLQQWQNSASGVLAKIDSAGSLTVPSLSVGGQGSFTGLIVGQTNTTTSVASSNDTGSISIRGNASVAAAMSFHRSGAYAINMGLDTDNNFKIGGWSASIIMMTLTPAGNLTVPGVVTGSSFSGNATTAYGLNVHTARNNEANKVVRTDGSGYLQVGYINSSNGNEGNNSSPARVWGTNGSDDYLRSYLTSALNVNSATTATTATGLNASNYIARTGSSGNLNTDFQNTPAGTLRYHGDDNGLTNGPGGSWWMYQNFRHSNASNYWGTQIAWGWEDNANKLAQRNITSNTFGSWVYYINSSNYQTYGLRNITQSTASPSGGVDGDVWIKYV